MSITATVGSTTYTVQEVRELRAAIREWLDANEQTLDPVLIELQVQSHIQSGHKASDI